VARVRGGGGAARRGRTALRPDGRWAAEHLLRRLASVRAAFAAAGAGAVVLDRGPIREGPPGPRGRASFVCAAFREDVARAHVEGRDRRTSGVLERRCAPVGRPPMTCLETDGMNGCYKEAEAVLLADEASPLL